MTEVVRVGEASRSVVSDDELVVSVRSSFRGHDVMRIEREYYPYSTSSTIEEVRVMLSDGTVCELLLKDSTREALLDDARATRPSFAIDRCREIPVYRDLLATAGIDTATCHASSEHADRCWLLLEKITGVELWQIGDTELWSAAARQLARIHAVLDDLLPRRPGVAATLTRHDAKSLSQWMDRALTFESQRGGRRTEDLQTISAAHRRAVDILLATPPVVLHGDCYASNVLITPQPLRVCLVDWEMASIGPAMLDLAALTAGEWAAERRQAIVAAYRDAMERSHWTPSPEEFEAVLSAARLQICVQWLGWSPTWKPPAEHAFDWLDEAKQLAGALS